MGVKLVSAFADEVTKLPGKIAAAVLDIGKKALDWANSLRNTALDMGARFVTGIMDALASLPGKIAGAVADAFRQLKVDVGPFHISGSGITVDMPNISLPSFAVGSWKLPRDMVAVVHQNEMIVPADIAARLRGEAGAATSSQTVSPVLSGAATIIVQIEQNFGPSSVRSREDILEIGRETADRARLLGLQVTGGAG